MLNSVEEPLQEHVVLLLVRKLRLAGRFKRSHQLAELLLVNLPIAVRVALQILDQGGEKAVLGLLVVLVVNWPFEQILNEGSDVDYFEEIVGVEVEQKRSEDVFICNAVLQQRVVVSVRPSAQVFGLLGSSLPLLGLTFRLLSRSLFVFHHNLN